MSAPAGPFPFASPSSRPVRSLLAAGTVVAAVATAGSLWLSLGLGLVPCRLCWYQRVLMYPLVAVLGVAVALDRPVVGAPAPLLAVPGVAVAAYHSWLQLRPRTPGCGFDTAPAGVSCSAVQYRVAGLSIPNLALLGFGLVCVALAGAHCARVRPRRDG